MYWSWQKGGIALGLVFLVTVAVVKPIGVSTQFVILDGIIASALDSSLIYSDEQAKNGYGSSNAYLDKSGGKYAEAIAHPFNYGFVFVLFMLLGGYIGSVLSGHKQTQQQIPAYHQQCFGESSALRYSLAFVGGVLVLWGARLAGGCTSGHMMSGMMQTSVSGYLFGAAAFATAIPVAFLLYKRQP